MKRAPASVLVVDDEELAVELYSTILDDAGYVDVLTCSDSRKVMDIVRANTVAIVLLDLNMPYVTGQELLDILHAEFPQIAVIVLTSEDRVETAVECMKKGAFDYIAKPVEERRLVSAVEHALTIQELRAEVAVFASGREELSHPEAFETIMTADPTMRRLFHYVEAIAASPKAVLVTGESGTGKELLARAIHDVSGRAGQFVAINVSGLDDTMFSDTLFGHVRGAYTGAQSVRKGLVQIAAGGTLFLDEIGDLPEGAQVKLLRLLQDGDYYPLGSDAPERASVRIVAATNADLDAKQEQGRFRKDLYYRLISHRVHLPPLRDRPDDVALLCRYFVDDAARSLGRDVPPVTSALVRLVSGYTFPGNIRELQAIMFDAVTRGAEGALSLEAIREYLAAHSGPTRESEGDRDRDPTVRNGDESGAPAEESGGASESPGPVFDLGSRNAFPTINEVEDTLIREALRRASGNQTAAARLLGISQSTLSRRLRQRS